MSAKTAIRKMDLAPDGDRFVWGEILHIHEVGNYFIVEFERNQAGNVSDEEWAQEESHISFHPYIRDLVVKGAYGRAGEMYTKDWEDTHHSYDSLDKALIACVIYAREACHRGLSAAMNERVTTAIMRMTGPDCQEDS